eukprot:CAMPEP_0180707652 /NCGR_PEP_ID=MMETSP1038_2-20121128/8826_1 /TAXON_ID=632150 /ORGANISM="Azadinium spinosum, Strain 3D9" /LENGTH=369 /DNA_ID=CAMNT_0022739611 /DNA_START=39 /DNA_END=1145 /DNA_ORIENTATION=-
MYTDASNIWGDGLHRAVRDHPDGNELRVSDSGPRATARERDWLRMQLQAASEEIGTAEQERDDALQRVHKLEHIVRKSVTWESSAVEEKSPTPEGGGEESAGMSSARSKGATTISNRRDPAQSQHPDHEEKVAAEAKLEAMRNRAHVLQNKVHEKLVEHAHLESTVAYALERGEALQGQNAELQEEAARAVHEAALAREQVGAQEAQLALMRSEVAEARAQGEDASIMAHQRSSLAGMRAVQLRRALDDSCSMRQKDVIADLSLGLASVSAQEIRDHEAGACQSSTMEPAGSQLVDNWELQLVKLGLETDALKAEVADLAAASVEVTARWEAKLRWESQGPPAIARLDFHHIDEDLAMLQRELMPHGSA